MPITFVDIEKQKSWRICSFFLLLIVLYFVIILALFASFYEILSLGLIYSGLFLSTGKLFIIFAFAVLIASVHFSLSAWNAAEHIKKNLGALPPDPDDEIHTRLIHITDEIRAATGNKEHIQCLVIPTLSMNALSAVDLRGNAFIAITEGLLSRLSRTQLEAVMAHEACHILSGDCLESTVAASIFGIPSSAIEKLITAFEGRVLFSPAFLFAWLMVKLSSLLNMFISREREYRADAGAVRMTRNPLALAEVLYMLSRNWRGGGFIGAGLEMLCFMNTSARALDESEGWFANLMSTHPPVRKRIHILLSMARASISELHKSARNRKVTVPKGSNESVFFALDHMHQWQGPFALAELAVLPWLTTLTWVSKDGDSVEKVSKIPVINSLFRERISQEEKEVSQYSCPSCGHFLLKKPYDGTMIYQCKFCGGALVEDRKIPRIIARKNQEFSERIHRVARMTLEKNQLKRITRNRKKADDTHVPLIHCPECNDPMMRTFYSHAYLIELDRCTCCSLTWFDYDELDMLQCMIDQKMASKPMPVYSETEITPNNS